MWRRHKSDRRESPETRAEKEKALYAQAERERIEAQWPKVQRITGGIREALERNHFGEQLTLAALRRRSP